MGRWPTVRGSNQQPSHHESYALTKYMPLRIFPFFIPVPYTCNTATYKTDRHTPTQIIAVPVEMPYHLISQNVKS